LPEQRPTLLGEALLPAKVRQRIRELAPECLVIVPDDALHKLPFEALLVEAGGKPAYVLDEEAKMPPLVYAPSVAIRARLAERPPAAGPVSLLTVADPAYPERKGVTPAATQPQDPQQVGLLRELHRLQHAARESERIRQLFNPAQVTARPGK